MRIERAATVIVSTTCLIVTASVASMSGAGRADATATPTCAALTGLALPDTVITSAALVAAQGSTPEYCRVLATVEPETDIEVRLPTAWTERLLHLGGAGLAGAVPNLATNAADLQAGYVLTASNGGHRDPTGARADSSTTRRWSRTSPTARSEDGACGQGAHRGVLRPGGETLLLLWVFGRRPRGPDCGSTLRRRGPTA